MAYKFQLGAARLSGSTTFEQPLVVEDSFSATSLSASGQLQVGGEVTLDGVGEAAGGVQVASDGFYIRDDSASGKVKFLAASTYATAIAGDGLAASSGVLAVGVDGSSIETSGDALRVKALGVTNAMLAGSITDSKLNQITTGDKVAGSAVQLAGTSALEDSTGLQLKAALAGDGLAMASQVLSVNVDDSSIETDSDSLRVKALGITNAMLAGSITDAKLNQITTGDKVAGSAVQLAGTSALEDSTGLRLKGTVAGDGLAISSQILSVNVDDATIETNGDTLRLKDNGVTLAKMAGITRGSLIVGDAAGDPSYLAKGTEAQFLQSNGNDPVYVTMSGDATIASGGAITIANNAITLAKMADDSVGADELVDASVGVAALSTAVAGDGLTGGGGSALAVQVSGAVVLASDKVGIADSFAGAGLGPVGGANSISSLNVLVDGSTIEIDSDLVRVKNVGITEAHLNASVAGVGLSGGAGSALALDLNELSAGIVDVAADSIAIIDANDGNASKKESIADFVAQLPAAGGGLSASAGKLSLADTVTTLGDSNATLAFGINVQTADMNGDRKHTLPAPVAGRKVVVKGKNTDVYTMTIEVDDTGDDRIDGEHTSIVIESKGGAVTLLCTSANRWIIV